MHGSYTHTSCEMFVLLHIVGCSTIQQFSKCSKSPWVISPSQLSHTTLAQSVSYYRWIPQDVGPVACCILFYHSAVSGRSWWSISLTCLLHNLPSCNTPPRYFGDPFRKITMLHIATFSFSHSAAVPSNEVLDKISTKQIFRHSQPESSRPQPTSRASSWGIAFWTLQCRGFFLTILRYSSTAGSMRCSWVTATCFRHGGNIYVLHKTMTNICSTLESSFRLGFHVRLRHHSIVQSKCLRGKLNISPKQSIVNTRHNYINHHTKRMEACHDRMLSTRHLVTDSLCVVEANDMQYQRHFSPILKIINQVFKIYSSIKPMGPRSTERHTRRYQSSCFREKRTGLFCCTSNNPLSLLVKC
jgi:hypothetical protein